MVRGSGGQTDRRASGRARQLTLNFPSTWGGARRGAGRKRSDPSGRARVPHHARPIHRAREPVHVTLRARLAVLRSEHVFPTIRLALARAARRDEARFRMLQYSVQSDHVHLIVEASDKRALSSGLRSVAIRIARYVNDLLARHGAFWADRWHGRVLRTPREMRHALVYVLANFRKHTSVHVAGIDPFSSGERFDGWRVTPATRPPWAFAPRWATDPRSAAVSEPRTWLARMGWRRHGLVGISEAPAAARRAESRRPRER